MKWKRAGKKDRGDVIDIRGAEQPSGGGRGGGGLGGLPIPMGAGGIGGGLGLVILLVVVGLQMCGNGGAGLRPRLDPRPGRGPAERRQPAARCPPDEDPQKDLKDFSSAVFVDAQNTWDSSFEAAGKRYEDAKLVLYSQAVNTGGCGSATSAVGPFYCPADSARLPRPHLLRGHGAPARRGATSPGPT